MIERFQPTNTGVDASGELVWANVPMSLWQMEMFRKHYKGEFLYQWSWVVNYERGWEEEDYIQGGEIL